MATDDLRVRWLSLQLEVRSAGRACWLTLRALVIQIGVEDWRRTSVKVLYVSPYPPATDGIGNYTWVLAGALREAGAEVRVVVPWWISGAPGEVIGSLGPGGKEYARLSALVAEVSPDVIHIQFAIAAFGTRTIALLRWLHELRRDLQIPVVATLHEFTRESRILPLAGQMVYRYVVRNCDQLIVHTDIALNAVVTRLGAADARVAVIPHPTGPVPTATSSCEELRSRFSLGDARVLLAFGFIHVDKGLDDLVQALGILRQTDPAAVEGVMLVVAGTVRSRRGVFRAFELRDRLHLLRVLRLARRSGLLEHVRLTGYVADGDIAGWFSMAEAVVLPYRRIEQSGVASLARSLGAPVLSSTAGGLAEQFAGSKWTFPPGSPGDLARSLGLFLSACRPEREVAPVVGHVDDLSSITTRTLGLYRAVISAREQGKGCHVA